MKYCWKWMYKSVQLHQLSEIETVVRLSKRRQKVGQPPNNTRLVVRHRPLNAQEFRMQRYRERMLEPTGEEEEEGSGEEGEDKSEKHYKEPLQAEQEFSGVGSDSSTTELSVTLTPRARFPKFLLPGLSRTEKDASEDEKQNGQDKEEDDASGKEKSESDQGGSGSEEERLTSKTSRSPSRSRSTSKSPPRSRSRSKSKSQSRSRSSSAASNKSASGSGSASASESGSESDK
ncbi:unnamed protein product [Timema podura]|uniref:Uncharacterized protein n=1 Tax=Timema podura TaxID=61482 RepID=A0ABN7P565_TIMPD|nr:unnamed protein product [Timema podura]